MGNGKVIFVPGILSSPTGLKDGTFKFTIYCNELPPEKIGQVFTLNNQYCYIGLKREDFLNAEREALDALEADETVGKTPSQRLRAVLFLNWKGNPEGFSNFDAYYKHKMERMIEHWKGKLD